MKPSQRPIPFRDAVRRVWELADRRAPGRERVLASFWQPPPPEQLARVVDFGSASTKPNAPRRR